MTFFNAMAVCLIAVLVRRAGASHSGLDEVVATLLARAREHRDVAFTQYCGNNAYLQQVAVDTVLLPLARGQDEAPSAGIDLLVREFQRYRTPEGFFFDLPRQGTDQEPLCPPTYVLKMLFLAGMCDQLSPSPPLADLFHAGMASVLPLFTREGHFCYFGRTDNSPFAAGLTIFNLRKAARSAPGGGLDFDAACVDAERYFASFPRTPSGLLHSNRFRNAESLQERNWSRDVYSHDGCYSVAACAYALLGCYWFPASGAVRAPERPREPAIVVSRDLGVAKLTARSSEVVVRIGCEATGWDRRYLGPTILRYQVDGQLLVGAIPRTLSTDASIRPPKSPNQIRRVYELLRNTFTNGIEQLDGTAVGFLPVLKEGSSDYLPYTVVEIFPAPSSLLVRYRMLCLHARGWRPCLKEVLEVLHNKVRVLGQKHYTRPGMRLVDSIEFSRRIRLDGERCRIEDTLSGDIAGKTLSFSVRRFPGTSVSLLGLRKRESITTWGSDGRQALDIHEVVIDGSEITYQCDIAIADSGLPERERAAMMAAETH
jgi:hypothetical protein